MKAWFVYLINGKRIAIWANNSEEAEKKLSAEYGNVDMKYLGIDYGCNGCTVKADGYCTRGMSLCDRMIASGMANLFVGLRYAR